MKTNSPSILPQRVLVEQTSGVEVVIPTTPWLALAKKAGKNNISLSVLEQVYARGVLDSQPHPKNTIEQQAFLRVESFIHRGKAYELDCDLVEACAVPDGRKHMGIIKSAIKRHEERNKPLKEDLGNIIGRSIRRAAIGTTRRKRTGLIGSVLGSSSRRTTRAPESYEDQVEKVAQKTQAGVEGRALGKQRAKEAAIQRAQTNKFKSSFEKSHSAYKVADTDDEQPTLGKRLKWRAQDYITNKGHGRTGASRSSRWKTTISPAHAAWTSSREKPTGITQRQTDTSYKGPPIQKQREETRRGYEEYKKKKRPWNPLR